MTTSKTENAQNAYKVQDSESSIRAHILSDSDEENQKAANETHKKVGEYIKSIVFGGLDGIITTFAVVSGATGGGLGVDVILILGFSNIIADAMSMGVGDALSTKAENEFILAERDREVWEYENYRQGEIDEMVEIFQEKGMSKEDATSSMNTMAKYKDIFVDLMMAYELELQIPGEDDNPWKDGAITFTSFVIFGLVPLLGYLILFSIPGYTQQDMFIAACILTALTLFALGAIKTKVTKQNWFKGGFEILIMGSSTALAAYFIGFLVKLAIEGGESSSLH